MGGPPSKGTAKDKRLKGNKTTTPPVLPTQPTPQKKPGQKGGK